MTAISHRKTGFLFLVIAMTLSALGLARAQSELTATLFKAARRGNLKAIAASIESGVDVNALDRNKNTPLILTSEHGHTGVARLLIERGADVNAADKDGRTALMAVSNAELAELLVTHGAKLEAVNRNGWTPLLYAAVHRNSPVIQVLVTNGAAVNAADRSGRTALMMLSDKGDREAIEFLLAHGADANLADSQGKTALMAAAREGRTLIAALLIKHGADVYVKEKFGKTARKIAEEHKLEEMADLLKNHKRAPTLLDGTGTIRLDERFLAGLLNEEKLKEIFGYGPAVKKTTRVRSGGRKGSVHIQGTVMAEGLFTCSVEMELHESATHADRYYHSTGGRFGAPKGKELDAGQIGDQSVAMCQDDLNATLTFTVDHISVWVSLMAPTEKLSEIGSIGRMVAKQLRPK